MTTVSAIVAVRNGANYLAEAVQSMLDQTVAPAEIIVIDDGSTDATIEIAGSFGGIVRVVSQAGAGQGAAFARGTSLASGDYLAFNDHDDLWPLRKLELQLAAFAADPALDAVYGLAEQFVSPELGGDVAARLRPPIPVLRGEAAQCMLIRADAFRRIGNFDPEQGSSAFLGWLGRAKLAGYRSLMLDEVVLRRRLHLTNYGRTRSQERDRSHLAALRQHLARRRS